MAVSGRAYRRSIGAWPTPRPSRKRSGWSARRAASCAAVTSGSFVQMLTIPVATTTRAVASSMARARANHSPSWPAGNQIAS